MKRRINQIINYESVVYVTHPFGGDNQNKEKVSEIMRTLTEESHTHLFVSGITTFGYCYFDTDYQRGLDMCLWLLHQCDECWIYGDYENSKGCVAEIKYCEETGIPYKIVK